MKKICSLLFMFVCVVVCAQTNGQKGLTIEGTAPANMEGQKVSIFQGGLFVGRSHQLAETTIKEGKFSFSFPEFSESAVLYLQGGRMHYNLGVNPGDKVIIADRNVTGATANEICKKMVDDAWSRYNAGRVEVFKKHKAIVDQVNEATDKTEAARLQATPEYQQFQADLAVWEKNQADYVTQQLKDNPNSVWALICLQYHGGFMTPTEEHYTMLSDELKQTSYGKSLRQKLDASLLGKKAPDFTLPDANGTEHSLASLLQGNKYLIIDFWASWCAPCRKGIPVMRKLVEKYEKEGVAIVNISTDKTQEPWLKALDQEKMEWTNLWDNAGMKGKYGVTGIPSVFLLKADGTVVFERLYGDAIAIELRRVFGY